MIVDIILILLYILCVFVTGGLLIKLAFWCADKKRWAMVIMSLALSAMALGLGVLLIIGFINVFL